MKEEAVLWIVVLIAQAVLCAVLYFKDYLPH